ncbi:MAG TPA: hypothetical protein VGX24_04660 [Pyrinomonadaceae bacterium]|nr:hypothetical protein [Pyrinomonadaceae bacterium]
MPEQLPIAGTKPIDIEKERATPRLVSLLFCDFWNQAEDGKINLIGIFDRIYVHSKGRLTPYFVLFIRSVDTIEESLKVRVFAPDDSPVVGIDFDDFDASVFTPNLPANVQSILKIRFPVESQGVYWFNVFYKGESLGGAGLVVEYRETEGRKGGTDTYV